MKDRKSQIMDVTESLIIEKGYEATSTIDIAARSNIARGTLYHHFKTKDDILNALVKRTLTNHIEKARKISLDKSIPVIERLLQTIISLQIKSEYGDVLLSHLNHPGNLALHNLVQIEMLKEIPGILTNVIIDGIKEGVFTTDYPYEIMEILVVYINVIIDGDLEYTEEEKGFKIYALLKNIERMLGSKEGAFDSIYKHFNFLQE